MPQKEVGKKSLTFFGSVLARADHNEDQIASTRQPQEDSRSYFLFLWLRDGCVRGLLGLNLASLFPLAGSKHLQTKNPPNYCKNYKILSLDSGQKREGKIQKTPNLLQNYNLYTCLAFFFSGLGRGRGFFVLLR